VFRSKKFIIIGIVVAIGLGFLLYTSLQAGSVYYYTVTEYKSQQQELSGKPVRVIGEVVKDSIQSEVATRTVKFTISEGGQNLSVVYTGAGVPDTFGPEAEVVVQGQMKSGVFQADTILTKCPSKYEGKVE